MKFTLSWLQQHITFFPAKGGKTILEILCETLNNVGLEVEGVEDRATALKDFTVAEIVEATQHPNADRLRVCKVNTGSEMLQVVCGAPNARAGIKVVLARPGMAVPSNGMVLKLSEIRGVQSQGMLCSLEELNLAEASEGILELPAHFEFGKPFAPQMGLDDPVIDIAITPNRPDCFGIQGIARDLAAAGIGEFKHKKIEPVVGKFPSPVQLQFGIREPEWCPLFAGRLIKGVKNGPSPEWLQKQLKAVGLRPISALVDITNFMTIDRCRPLHVFDADKIKGKLTIRAAHKDETIKALDGKTYTLNPHMCVIADDAGVQSLAGIMGGEASGCTEETVNVFVESALWDEYNIAKTGRALGIHSDARQRFERGVDPQFTIEGLEMATQMILELCGGEASEVVHIGEMPENERMVVFPITEVKRLTGVDMPPFEMKLVLQALGFYVGSVNSDEWRIAVPSWRPDVHGKADIVEEIIRILGLARVEAIPFPRLPIINDPVLTLKQHRVRRARRTLTSRGYNEAVTWSFISESEAKAFDGNIAELTLENPISQELSVMRPSLLPGLLSSIARNQNRGFDDLAFTEIGHVFKNRAPEGQKTYATAIRVGLVSQARHWAEKPQEADFYAIKEDLWAMLEGLGFTPENAQLSTENLPDYFHPGRSVALKLGKVVIGYCGEIHPAIVKQFDVKGRPVALEIDLEAIPAPKKKLTKSRLPLELNPLQSISRDFAFIVEPQVKGGDLLRAVQKAEPAHITGVRLFDVYEGKGMEGKKSLALEVTLQPKDKSFTDVEIEAISEKIVKAAAAGVGAVLRK